MKLSPPNDAVRINEAKLKRMEAELQEANAAMKAMSARCEHLYRQVCQQTDFLAFVLAQAKETLT